MMINERLETNVTFYLATIVGRSFFPINFCEITVENCLLVYARDSAVKTIYICNTLRLVGFHFLPFKKS